MTTIGKPVGSGEFEFHRGNDERPGVRWTVHVPGSGIEPMDLSNWTATFEMRVDGELVYTKQCICTSDGYAYSDIPGSTFEDSKFDALARGEWRIMAYGPSGQRELLGWGNYVIS